MTEKKPHPPVYLAADLWDALGARTSDFDPYYARNGWANTWANLLGVVRDRFRPKCGEDAEGEPCVLAAGHLPPHYGAGDVGSYEPVPVPEVPAPTGPHCIGCAKFEHHHCYHCGKRAGLPHPTWCPNFDASGPAPQVEFPFTLNGITIEQEDAGLWITVDDGKPRWLGPRTLSALRASRAVQS